MRYFKRYWNQARGDPHNAWGCSWWYFETDEAGVVTRQIEKYDRGPTLRYSDSHQEDEFGMLSETPLDFLDFLDFEITSDEFQNAWSA